MTWPLVLSRPRPSQALDETRPSPTRPTQPRSLRKIVGKLSPRSSLELRRLLLIGGARGFSVTSPTLGPWYDRWDTCHIPTPTLTPRRAGHDGYCAIHFRHCGICPRHYVYGWTQRWCHKSFPALIVTHPSEPPNMDTEKRPRESTQNDEQGRYGYYRYEHHVHGIGMARHERCRDKRTHTTIVTGYSTRNGEPHLHRTMPWFIPSDQDQNIRTRTHVTPASPCGL